MACFISRFRGCADYTAEVCNQRASRVYEGCSLSERANFVYKTFANLYLAPAFVGAAWLGTVSALTGGVQSEGVNRSQKQLGQTEKVVSLTYLSLFGIIYPETAKGIKQRPSYVEGLLLTLVDHADESARSDSRFRQHVVSRGQYFFAAVVAVISRVVLSALGFVAAIFSFIPLRHQQSSAELAFQELQFPGLVKDSLFCLTRFINPWAHIRYNGTSVRG